MTSFFGRLFHKKEEEKIPASPGGLVEYFQPAQPPALSEDLFSLLAPLPPAELLAPQFEILAPAHPSPAAAPPRRGPLTDVFFPAEGRVPEAQRPREAGTGFFDLFAKPEESWDAERARRGIMSKAYLDRLVDLGDLVRMVKEGRKDPSFQREVDKTLQGGPPAELPLIRLAKEEHGSEDLVADFLGIPRTELRKLERSRQDPWPELLNPILYDVERGLEWYLGDEVPGVFHFGVNDQGEFGLFYLEDHPDL